MRIIAAIGRLGVDLEMRVVPRGKDTPPMLGSGEVEVHDVSSDHAIANHIIGFIADPNEDEGDE